MVVEIEQLDHLVAVTQVVTAEVHLDPAAGILQVTEHHFALGSPGHDTPGDGYSGPVVGHALLVRQAGLLGGVRALVAVGEGLNTQRLQRGPLFSSGRFDI